MKYFRKPRKEIWLVVDLAFHSFVFSNMAVFIYIFILNLTLDISKLVMTLSGKNVQLKTEALLNKEAQRDTF